MFLGIVTAAGCGQGRPPPIADPEIPPSPPSGGGDGFDFDASSKPPGCGVSPDGGHCDCVDVNLLTDPPNLYFVLDRSGSMADGAKWTAVRVTVGKVMRSLGSRANFGAAMFPSVSSDCAPGTEVMSVRAGDSPAATDGPTTTFLLTVTNVSPSGGTPTAATLAELGGMLAQLPGKTYVILATDGGPNCNASANCGAESCMPNMEGVGGCSPTGQNCCAAPIGIPENCLDDGPSTAAVSALAASGVPTYVIGVPGSGPYANVLAALAKAGGTALPTDPFYYRVDTADATAILAALRKIAAKITSTCTFTLKAPPDNPGMVNVYLDEVVLPQDPTNGWKLDGATVTLLGTACDRVMNGDVLDVRIISGCPTVIN